MKRWIIIAVAFLFCMSLGYAAYAQTTQGRGTTGDQRDTSGQTGAATDRGATGERGTLERSTTDRMERRTDADKYQTLSGEEIFKANDLVGMKIENLQGDDLGKISDIAIDPKDSRVAFAIVGHGGILGVGEKYVAIPMSALTLKGDEKGKPKLFVLDISKDRLAQAPTFDKDSLPDRAKAEEYYRYFGQQPYWGSEGASGRGTMPSSTEQRGSGSSKEKTVK